MRAAQRWLRLPDSRVRTTAVPIDTRVPIPNARPAATVQQRKWKSPETAGHCWTLLDTAGP
eukprot:10897942-Alexandrium_andersonii.AAC.1